ncbi:uncharacterized protein LOC112556550 [Pomacea canaliculata]|uniref:uncharacterized protein LOC112556550 n=1 Tax=Pomacea canaliculata TaxID=400727 RepID=UPI000D735EB2|nr:uncharacterized protein LOC112556550 [Pomacea canaliculata]
MPSKNCAIPGCPACKSRHRGLSFFRIKRVDNKDWERALVRAVNRCDSSFNVEIATICSRHFKPECYIEGEGFSRHLIPGSLPTEFMPKKSIETPKPEARKPPTRRPSPEPVERVKYYTYDEVRKAAVKELPSPWRLLSDTSDNIILASFSEKFQVRVKVTIMPDFAVRVSAFDFLIHNFAANVEKTSVTELLKKISSLHLCPGVTDHTLQNFAELPIVDSQQLYFRHIQYTTDETGNITHLSSVRSKSCELLLESECELCKQCAYTQTLLVKRLRYVEEHKNKPLSKNTPLQRVNREKLVLEVKKLRKNNKLLLMSLDTN